ncbi:MAG TPA: hypothetical protein PK857_00500 [Hyphomicrobium sp.]|nr:hypothetical protein [Hyphomicrobium sp.]HRO48780.1 hypothetical protein [Hyphomicrobium sp.]
MKLKDYGRVGGLQAELHQIDALIARLRDAHGLSVGTVRTRSDIADTLLWGFRIGEQERVFEALKRVVNDEMSARRAGVIAELAELGVTVDPGPAPTGENSPPGDPS